MSASLGAAPPPPAPPVPAGIEFEDGGQVTALWATAFGVANLYAIFWLTLALLNARPHLRRAAGAAWRRAVRRMWCGSNSTPAAVTVMHAAEALTPPQAAEATGAPPHASSASSSSPPTAAAATTAQHHPGGGAASAREGADGLASRRCTPSALADIQQPAAAERLELEWRGLGVTVVSGATKRAILQGVYGRARPGEMQALLGPSGAGKSTLLDLLAMRTSNGRGTEVCGCVLVDGRPRVAEDLLARSTYVPQHDNLAPTLSALESLRFYASVILPPATPRVAREARVADTLRVMGLEGQAGTLVGGPLPGGLTLRGLSGGERKRLAIATGVVARPSLVFLDEPTTGLDSFGALSVMRFLSGLAAGGHTLLASVHQPRGAIWGLFDQVTLLSQGRLLYHGPTAHLSDWFSGLGYQWDPNRHGTASDWVIDLVSVAPAVPQQSGPREADIAAKDGAPAAGTAIRSRHAQGYIASVADLEAAAAAFSRHLATTQPDLFPPFAVEGVHNGSAKQPSSTQGAPAAVAPTPVEAPRWRAWWGKGLIAAAAPAAPIDAAAAAAASENGGGLEVKRRSPGSSRQHGGADAEKGADEGAATKVAEAAAPPRPPRRAAPPSRTAEGLHRQWTHFCALAWREALTMTRNPADVAGRMLIFSYVAVLGGLILGVAAANAGGIRLRVNVIFSDLVFYMLMPFIFMSLFVGDKQFFLADVGGRLYHPLPYYLAKVAVATPFNVAVAVVFQFISYGMTGLRHSASALMACTLLAVLMVLVAMQVVHCCAVWAPSQDLAFAAAIGFTAINLLISNFFILYSQYSLYWVSYLRYVSAIGYAFEGQLVVELDNRWFNCSSASGLEAFGIYSELIPSNGTLGLVRRGVENLGPGCVASGNAVLDFYGVGHSYGFYVGVLCAYLAIVHLLTYAGLHKGSARLVVRQ